jgi:hypothetical protein
MLSSGKVVPAVIDTMIMNNQKDAEGQFFRQFNQHGSCGSVRYITASGKDVTQLGKNWDEFFVEWKKLPVEDRQPKVAELTNPDPNVPLNRLPKGALRIKLYSRGLDRDTKGELSPKLWKEYWSREAGGDWPAKAEPGHDYLWVKPENWKLLLPPDLKKGDKFPLPQALVKQLICDPLTHTAWYRQPPVWWNTHNVRSLKVDVVVDDVSPGSMRLRIQGPVLLEGTLRDAFFGDRAKTKDGTPIPQTSQLKFDGRLLGYLTYDRLREEFRRFDIVALGDFVCFLCDANGLGDIKSYTLGVAYALDTGPLVPPAHWHSEYHNR